MRISDWSSDVCSSDLIAGVAFTEVEQVAHHLAFERREIALGVGAGLAFMLVDHLLEPGSKRLVGLVAEQRSEEHTSELQSLMRISYAVFCLKKKNRKHTSS